MNLAFGETCSLLLVRNVCKREVHDSLVIGQHDLSNLYVRAKNFMTTCQEVAVKFLLDVEIAIRKITATGDQAAVNLIVYNFD